MSFDPKPYAEGIRRLNDLERRRTAERARAALDEATSLSERMAAADRGITRIYLFGSLAGGAPRNPDFDIDLAIEGGDLYRALEVTETSSFEVDLISLERVAEHVRRRILESGRILYERKES